MYVCDVSERSLAVHAKKKGEIKNPKHLTMMNEGNVLQSDGGLENCRSESLVFIHEPSRWQQKKAGFIALFHLFT